MLFGFFSSIKAALLNSISYCEESPFALVERSDLGGKTRGFIEGNVLALMNTFVDLCYNWLARRDLSLTRSELWALLRFSELSCEKGS